MEKSYLTKPNKIRRGQIAYLNIFTMRFLGKTFDEISKATGYNANYLRQLFMQGGKLNQPWKEFESLARESSINEAYTVIFGKLPDIVRTMAVTAQMPYEPSGVMAGKTLMEYAVGKPADKPHDQIPGAMTTSDLVERVALRRKQNQNDDPGAGGSASTGVAG